MKERYKVLIVTALLSLGLWFGMNRFLVGTGDFADGLDVRDVAYLDPPEPVARVNLNESFEADQSAPEHEAGGSPIRESAELVAEGEMIDVETDEVEIEEGAEKEIEAAASEEEAAVIAERVDSDADIAELPAAQSVAVDIVTSADERKLVEQLNAIDEDLLGDTPATRAIDLRLSFETLATCVLASEAPFRTGVRFRYETRAIKGASLNRIDIFLQLWKRCGSDALLVESNPQGQVDGDDELDARRRDEVKYYLLQRGVPKESIEQVPRS